LERKENMNGINFNDRQIEALWKKAEAANIPRSEFLTNLNTNGAAAVLDE
jgi:hypothetical protein